MTKQKKIALIIGVVMLTGIINQALMQGTGRTRSSGPLGIVVFVAAIYACRAIWMYQPPEESSKKGESELRGMLNAGKDAAKDSFQSSIPFLLVMAALTIFILMANGC